MTEMINTDTPVLLFEQLFTHVFFKVTAIYSSIS